MVSVSGHGTNTPPVPSSVQEHVWCIHFHVVTPVDKFSNKGMRSLGGAQPSLYLFGISLCFWNKSMWDFQTHIQGLQQHGVPKQKWTASSWFFEVPAQLIHSEKDQLFSMILLFIRPVKQNTMLEAVQEICSDYFTWIFLRGRQPSVNHFYFSHWQEVLIIFLKIKLGVGSSFSVFLVH